MNRHQVLTGATNSGDHCFSSGSVEGVHFTAYATGCDIVILASDFQRVQIIPGAIHGKIQVACVNCSADSGKIAASYGEKVCVFEPTPLLNPQSTHKLDYQWYHTGTITADCQVRAVSWNQDGSRLLTGGDVIQMWQCPELPPTDHGGAGEDGVSFFIDDGGQEEKLEWRCIWHCRPATPVNKLMFSPDSLLFASIGKDDRLAKIWYENRKVQFKLMRTDSISPKKEEINYAFVYIAHPKAVTGFSWRKTSKYMPRGSVANMLITSCRDNICRIWVETILPEDGLIDMQQLEPQAVHPMFHTHRHKNRFMQRLHHIRHVASRRRRNVGGNPPQGMTPLPSAQSEHDFHKFGVHPNSVAPGFHFHLAASINPETDIPLLPVVNSQHPERDSGFVVHWLNNKELHFTVEAEKILMDMSKDTTTARDEDPDQKSDEVDVESTSEETKPPEVTEPVTVAPTSSKRGHKFLHRNRSHMSVESDVSMGSMASMHSALSQATQNSGQTEGSKIVEAMDKEKEPESLALDQKRSKKKKQKGKKKKFGECPSSPQDFVKALRFCISAPNLRKLNVEEDVNLDIEIVDDDMFGASGNDPIYAALNFLDIRRSASSYLSMGGPELTSRMTPSSFGMSLGNISKYVSFADLASTFPRVRSYATLCRIQDGHLDALDYRIEALLRDWHQSVDMLFGIHPVDGSFLVWLIDWLDEYTPGAFRQAQVSFSSRIPHALPVCDAMTMSTNLQLYCNHSKLDIKATLKESASKVTDIEKPVPPSYQSFATGRNSPGQSDNTMSPNVLMLSKHSNGTLNLWQITFAENSRFSTILSVAHASRASGHRFHANSAACHPVLPLLVTTSHHNSPVEDSNITHELNSEPGGTNVNTEEEGFCSELILWRVDPVGPLSQSGGITELARINSPEVSAFSNVAWLPTLLPSSTLGPVSNSPSALFVASDGSTLQIYMAVIDARTLLTELRAKPKSEVLDMSRSNSSTSSGYVMNSPSQDALMKEVYNVVSLQSTARPGCIIELQNISDAKQDWKHVQLMHVFQEQLVTGKKTPQYDKKGHTNIEAIVDLQNITVFEEHFYLLVVDRMPSGVSVLHMWRIVIASMEDQSQTDGQSMYSPDTNFFQDSDEQDTHGHHAMPNSGENGQMATPRISITSNKVCTQVLELPDGIKVTNATMSAGHLSSSTIYPACFAPYLLSTACTDGQVRFWKCQQSNEEEESSALPKFEWVEWDMMIPSEDASTISVAGKPLSVSCSYSGRVAVAYRMGHVRTQNDNPDSKFVNLYVSIYECESTGGSEWTLEDTIQLKNISIPEAKCNIDLSVIYNNDHNSDDEGDGYVLISPTMATPAIVRNVPIPSNATIQSVKKTLNTRVDHSNVLKQKHLVLLDWVSTEDGSHILTVGVGPKILLYAPVSSEVAQASKKDKDTKKVPIRRQLQKTKSMTVMSFVEEIRWMKIRSIDLSTSDGLPPLPMHISWVRDGILVVGMDNEMHVYSQWRGPGEGMDALGGVHDEGIVADNRTLTEQSLRSVASSASLGVPKAFKNSYSSTSITALASSVSSASLDKRGTPNREKEIKKSESVSSMQLIQDCGLFEAARLANPVLPQYHPKQLIELLNFGKIRRVKAILAHLVRCIAGNEYGLSAGMAADDVSARYRLFSSPRPLSVTASATTTDGKLMTEDSSDSLEIASIPPLPLYALLAADNEKITYNLDTSGATPVGGGSTSKDQDYSALFNPDLDEDLEDPFDDNEIFATSPGGRDRRKSSVSQGPQNPNHFGPPQSRLLARHLTRTQLPGLASLDQMYLLALADTVANTRVEFGEKETPDMAVSKVVARESGQPDINTEGLDDCGLRYMLAARHHVYLMNTLPIVQRIKFQKTGLSPAILVWAFHSEAEEELLNVIPSVQKGEPKWNELRVFGVGWWIRNITSLRKIIEKTAKAAFQVKKDPMDAALFYIAMKKKTLVWGLFRSVSDQKMADFFKNDFTQDRWRRAALKNAFALMGRQRFHHAAAFFLLAGAVQDAVEVCLNKLSDLQLAMVISRLYESEYDDMMPSGLKRLLYDVCLGGEADDVDVSAMHPDPFIRSMAYWMLKDYSASLGTLLETQAGLNYSEKDKEEDNEDSYNSSPNVFNFYNYLRTHPLLVRQQLAMTAADKNQTVLLSGFSRGNIQGSNEDKNVTYVDRITPVERRLYFTTAHMHFKSGCPMLALEVLSTLPEIIDMDSDITKSRSADSMTKQASITTGTLPDTSKSSDFDWSQPVSNKIETADTFDLSTPVMANTSQNVDSFDWSTPVTKFEDEGLDLSLDKEGDQDDGDTKSDSQIERKDKLNFGASSDAGLKDTAISHGKGDIMTHQLKFIACLKIMMEELSTLATGFEVDGGQLRYQLYIWLERQVDCLRQQCGYGMDIDAMHPIAIKANKDTADSQETAAASALTGTETEEKATLHKVILAEKLDFEAKQVRMARRKLWLKANQQLLRTLLSYSVLHGSCGGGLASVRMELILLLQELQQEKTRQQLLSPLPFPTSLPLLSASVASAKTVIADPIRHLQSMTQDILHSLVEFTVPPALNHQLNRVFLLRNLSAALAACVYQCLCDSDSFVVSLSDHIDVGMEGFANTSVVYKDSYLMAGAQHKGRTSSGSEPDSPNSQPAKWPGVSQLRALLAREKDEDLPKLNILLCEILVSVYMSLLVHALAMFDANILYRLVAHPFNEKMWPALFGGGVRKLVEVTTSSVAQQRHAKPQDELAKQRMKLHMKIMGGPNSPGGQHLKEDKPTYKEKFVPPEVSMISYFMTKPYQNPNDETVDYDSAESAPSTDEEEEEDDFDFKPIKRRDAAMNEHLDPNSYSWCLLRHAIVKYIRQSLLSFLPKIGIEIPELPVCSPLMQSVCKTMEKWEEILQTQLDLFNGPPEDYIPGCFVDSSVSGPPIHKYKTMTEPSNTPFLSGHFSALPAKRLWHYLIKQEALQDTFIRYIFRKRKHLEDDSSMRGADHQSDSGSSGGVLTQPMKIIHKEQEVITSFCLNQANLNCMAVATQKEIVEMDVSGILNPPTWLEDETEYDIEAIRCPSPNKVEAEEFLLIQAPSDKPGMIGSPSMSNMQTPTAPGVVPAPSAGSMSHTGRGAGVDIRIKGLNIPGITHPHYSYYIADRSQRLLRRLAKRPTGGVKRMGAHPHLPYYLTGSQDGSVRLWEWGHNQCIAVARQPGTFPKVTKVLFNAQGNKFGVSDVEGSLCLWQVGLGVNMNKPYLNLKCHNKTTTDFVFVGSSSLLATGGHSSNGHSVCLWDTLLPKSSSLVQGFSCHNDGCSAILFSPKHQVLISSGKTGDICLFDMRHRHLRHTFQAHDSSIRCMALDPAEEFFVTGSADGDIKVWSLGVHNLAYSFPGEHAKNSIFRNMGSGVTQLHMSINSHLFSCGADGSMKVRYLPDRHSIVNTYI